LPIVRDKIPSDLNIEEYIRLRLSESNKLFKV
jgi:hypothetical protein